MEGEEEEEEETPPGVPATDLQFGNDFDHPIRDRLPPGFGTAMNIVKWWIDPGLEGDPYADNPYLYGPALSSFNAVHVGQGEYDEAKGGLWFDEGGDEEGLAWRRGLGAPDEAKARMKWALRRDSKEKWVWEYGRTYGVDFFNPYIDFSEFALRLPGFNLPIMKYWDGQGLRYVVCITPFIAFQHCCRFWHHSQGQLSHLSPGTTASAHTSSDMSFETARRGRFTLSCFLRCTWPKTSTRMGH